jgi:hypothetical protein
VIASAIALAVLRHADVIDNHTERVLGWIVIAVILYSAYMWATRVKRKVWAKRFAVSESRRRRAWRSRYRY